VKSRPAMFRAMWEAWEQAPGERNSFILRWGGWVAGKYEFRLWCNAPLPRRNESLPSPTPAMAFG
jgi:hypothetical protein